MRVVAVMLTHNPRATLWQSLTALAGQKVPMTLMLCDNESTDASGWWMSTARFKSDLVAAGIAEVRILPPIPWKGHIFKGKDILNKTVEHAAAKFAWECSQMQPQPDAILWVDPDVIMPHGCVTKLIEGMEANPRLGGLGVDYDVPVDHVRMGCTLYRFAAWAELAEIGFFSEGCVCRWIHRTMESRGWMVEKLPGFTAKHEKRKEKPCPSQTTLQS